MISLDTYYSSSQYKGTSGSNIGREGYVPQAKIGESGNYLRGDGKWIDFGLANLTSTYTTVRSLSDSWEESASITPLQTASASWDSAYTTTNTNSAFWSTAYTNLVNNSANYLSGFDLTAIAAASGNWNSNYTSFSTNSAKYDSNWTITNASSSSYIRGVDWSTGSISSSYAWNSVAYGNGIFVAVATDYGIAYSRDGINWVLNSSFTTNNWTGVTFGRGIFVAVANGGSNRVMTSPDGINWTLRTAAEANAWRNVTYGNGLFVAVANAGSSSRVMYSSDGINWTGVGVTAIGWSAVAYGNGVFVAVSNTAGSPSINRVMTSPDGINWTIRAAASSDQWISLAYGNGLFVAGASSGTARIMTSPDGITWTSRAVTGGNWNNIAYGNGVYVAASLTASGSKWMYSFDGINWVVKTGAEAETYAAVAYGNGIFVILANAGTNRALYSGRRITDETLDNIRLGGFTINGFLSSSSVIFASGGNSDQWNSVYTSFNSNSAKYESSYTSVNSNSANWSNWSTVSSRYTTLDYLSTNNVLLSSASITDNLTVGLISVSSSATGTGNLTGLYRMTNEIINGYPVFRNIYNNSYIARGVGPDAWYLYLNSLLPVYYNTTTSSPWTGTWFIIPGRPSPSPTVSIFNPYLNSLGTITVLNQGNSNQWNSSWTITNSNSANWSSVYNSYNSISGRYTTLDYLSTNNVLLSSATLLNYLSTNAIYSSGTTGVISDSPLETGSGDFTLTLKFVNGVYVKNNLNALNNLSAGNIVYAQGGSSTIWNSNWTSFNTNSAKYDSNYTTTSNNSGRWESNWTSFNTNSAKYDSNYTTTSNNSGRWESNWTSFNTNSGKYDSVFTTTNSNSANWSTFTQNFSTFNTTLATIDPTVLWVSTLSGVIPGSEISSRLSTSRGKIRGKIFFNMINSIVNKNLYLRFADNVTFTSPTNIINAGNANTQTLTRTFEGILLPGNQIIFSPSQGNVEDGTRNNPYTTYNYTPGASIYYQIGMSIGSGSEFAAISGGYISVTPD